MNILYQFAFMPILFILFNYTLLLFMVFLSILYEVIFNLARNTCSYKAPNMRSLNGSCPLVPHI